MEINIVPENVAFVSLLTNDNFLPGILALIKVILGFVTLKYLILMASVFAIDYPKTFRQAHPRYGNK